VKILTTVKKVVDVELNMRVKDGAIVEEGMQYVMNAWDENAVEATLQIMEKNKADTTMVSIGGGEDVVKVIRRGFAMGIKNAVQIDDPALAGADAFTTARALQKVYDKVKYDLVICGKQAQDTDNGQTGIILAEYLGLPCVSNAIAIEVMDDKHIKVSRLGDFGTEIVELELPAVVTVDVAINVPRLPQTRGIMMAKKMPIEVTNLSKLGTSAAEVSGAGITANVIEFIAPESRKTGRKFEGDAAKITAEVVGLLVNEAKVL
jgi:electron transfer flavoprotein beta subunit